MSPPPVCTLTGCLDAPMEARFSYPGTDSPAAARTPSGAADSFHALAAELSEGIVITALERSTLLYANPRAVELWRLEGTAELGLLRSQMFVLTQDPAAVALHWAQARDPDGWSEAGDTVLVLQNGQRLRWRTHRVRHEGLPAELHRFLTESGPAPPAERGTDSLFRLAFEEAAVGMALVGADLKLLRVNESLCRLLGYEPGELARRTVFDVFHSGDRREDSAIRHALRSGQESFHLDRRLVRSDGQVRWAHLSVSVVRDERGRPVYYVAMAEDVTERRRADEIRDQRTRELQALATIDVKTGLYNHRFMQEFLSRRLDEAREASQPVSVLMLDLDHFRALNEGFGHDSGDRALRAVADCLRHALREEDVACRYGGEEFVMILAGAPHEAAVSVAERVRRRVEEQPPVAPGAGTLTCSVGVASFPLHASTAASLVKAADLALYHAKRAGRNRTIGYIPSPYVAPPDHLETLEDGLRGASQEAVNALITAIDLRDRYTGAHCQRVARLAVQIAEALGCSDRELDTLRTGAALLDVGKIGLPDSLLVKPGRLTRAEWEQVRRHPLLGEQLLRQTALPAEVLQLVRWHHERLDGSGYPDGLAGDEIPRLVRIVHVADVACALSDDRPHRPAWPLDRVIEHLRQVAGAKLDAAAVDAYCRALRDS